MYLSRLSYEDHPWGIAMKVFPPFSLQNLRNTIIFISIDVPYNLYVHMLICKMIVRLSAYTLIIGVPY